jgi:serine/threonine protein phosphatase PrpC
MEDYVIDYSEKEQEKFFNVFGIFDGYRGKEVPKYLQAHFMDYLKKQTNLKKENLRML